MAESKGITIRWPPEIRDKIETLAERTGISFGKTVVNLVKEGLELAEVKENGARKAAEEYIRNKYLEATEISPKAEKAQ